MHVVRVLVSQGILQLVEKVAVLIEVLFHRATGLPQEELGLPVGLVLLDQFSIDIRVFGPRVI